MLERSIELNTPDGAMTTYLAQPDARDSWPLVLLLMDAPGIREELREMARRWVRAGFAVALPNLYYRTTAPGFPTDRETMYQHMNAVSAAGCNADLGHLVQWCSGVPGVRTDAIGCVGYCMSGPLAIAAAAHFGERMRAAASIHGVRLCHQGASSAHRVLSEVRARLYIGCAAEDAWAPPAVIAALERALATHKLDAEVEWYLDTRHGFVFPERQAVYRHAAAEQHWQQLLALFSAQLR